MPNDKSESTQSKLNTSSGTFEQLIRNAVEFVWSNPRRKGFVIVVTAIWLVFLFVTHSLLPGLITGAVVAFMVRRKGSDPRLRVRDYASAAIITAPIMLVVWSVGSLDDTSIEKRAAWAQAWSETCGASAPLVAGHRDRLERYLDYKSKGDAKVLGLKRQLVREEYEFQLNSIYSNRNRPTPPCKEVLSELTSGPL